MRPDTRRLNDLAAEARAERLGRLRDVLAAERAVLFAYAFGSFVEGGPFEDIDLAVFVDPGAGVTDRLAFQFDLAARLESAVRLPVDIVILDEVPPGLQAAAVRGRLVFCRDEARRVAFLEQLGLQRMDTAFLRRASLEDLAGF